MPPALTSVKKNDAPMLPSDKENRPPQQTKRTASISGIFEQAKSLKRARDYEQAHNGPFAQSIKQAKTLVADANFFAQFRKPKDGEHPLSRNFADAAKDYCESARASREEQLEAIYVARVTRIDGLDDDGLRTERPGIPTQAHWNALQKTEELLDSPLEDKVMTIKFPQPDGTSRTKQIRLGDTLEKLQQRYATKSAEIRQLHAQLARVDTEINELKEQLLADNDKLQLINEEHEADMAALAEEVEAAKAQTFGEILEAEREEKRAAREFSKRVKEFFDVIS